MEVPAWKAIGVEIVSESTHEMKHGGTCFHCFMKKALAFVNQLGFWQSILLSFVISLSCTLLVASICRMCSSDEEDEEVPQGAVLVTSTPMEEYMMNVAVLPTAPKLVIESSASQV